MIITLNSSYQIDCLSPFHLVIFLRFVLFLHLKQSSVFSFCLILCVYLFVFDRSITFPDLGEVALCKRCPVGPTLMLPSVYQIQMLQECTLCGLCAPFCCCGASYCVFAGACPRPSWLRGLALCCYWGYIAGQCRPPSTSGYETWWHETAVSNPVGEAVPCPNRLEDSAMVPANSGVIRVKWNPKSVCLQPLIPQDSSSCLLPLFPGSFLRLANRSDPGLCTWIWIKWVFACTL